MEKQGLRKIRTEPWFKNEKNISLEKSVIEETIKKLKLTKCPVCKGDLSQKDNFDLSLPFNENYVEKYCPKDNYIIRLIALKYAGNTFGTSVFMEIHTNSRYSQLIASSGELADFSKHVNIFHF